MTRRLKNVFTLTSLQNKPKELRNGLKRPMTCMDEGSEVRGVGGEVGREVGREGVIRLREQRGRKKNRERGKRYIE